MDRSQQPSGSKGGSATSPDDSATSSQQTRETRSKSQLSNPSSNSKEINTAAEGKEHLTRIALTPPGVKFTTNILVTTLLFIAETKGVTHAAKSAIRSVALILEESDTETKEDLLTEEIKRQMGKEHDKLSSVVTSAMEEIKSTIANSITETRKIMDESVTKHAQNVQSAIPSYRDALVQNNDANKASATDPRLLARESIKRRQILFDIDPNSDELRIKDDPSILKTFNDAITKLDDTNSKERQLRSIRKLKNGGILVEARSEEAAQWLQQKEVAEKFKDELKQAVSYKKRSHNTIAFFVPLTFNPDIPVNIEEIQETNDIPNGAIIKAKWAKAPERRTPSQSCGHLIISFSDPDIANRAILNGIIICNKRVTVQKCKKEPLRCLKCHGWNHVAAGCSNQTDTCGTCGGNDHRTGNCTNSGVKRCVPCKTDGHTSWDRNCPTFLQKCVDQNARNPENSMPFFPSTDSWTWAQNPPTQTTPTTQAPSFLEQAMRPQRKQRFRQTQLPYGNDRNNNNDKRGYDHDIWISPQDNDGWGGRQGNNTWTNPELAGDNWPDRQKEPDRQPPPHIQQSNEDRQQPQPPSLGNE
jgi:hypothetical protein